MEGLSWTDLDAGEQRAIAMLADGVSPELCDPVALLTLRRIGLVRGARLTASGALDDPRPSGLRKDAGQYPVSAVFRYRFLNGRLPQVRRISNDRRSI
jgi:hypothetical protein